MKGYTQRGRDRLLANESGARVKRSGDDSSFAIGARSALTAGNAGAAARHRGTAGTTQPQTAARPDRPARGDFAAAAIAAVAANASGTAPNRPLPRRWPLRPSR